MKIWNRTCCSVAVGFAFGLGCAAADDFEPLFNGKDIADWQGIGGDASANWVVKDGVLSCTGKPGAQWIGTKAEFDHFELKLEFNVPADGNSGVFIRAPKDNNAYVTGMEIQILDDRGEKWKGLKPDQFTGAIYAALAPSSTVTKAAGEWQTMRIWCVGRKCKVWINDKQVIDADLDAVAKEFGKKVPGLYRKTGHIGFQNHGAPVSYRNVYLKKLEAPKAD